ncbi:cytochrome P450 [Russula vinacea]|nr:cytochrome P450 [Russula vinacea]
MIKDGYQKTRRGLFKIADFRRWVVLASGSDLIEDFLQPEYTIDLLNANDTFHTDVVRSKLTRNIAVTFKEVREELAMAMDDFIPTREDSNAGWVRVPIQETLQRVICRTTNRIFVGVPLCRDYDYQTLNLTFAVNVVKFGLIISLFPKPLRLIVSRLLSSLPSQIQQQIEFIRPMVEERFAKMEEYGEDWDDKPNDMLMWLMSEAKGVERSLEGVARRLLVLNFAGIHTTLWQTLTQVLYRLLANPEYFEPLREEVDSMHKIDSFLRESQRLDGLSYMTATRLAMRPFTFSNGVTVPAGTIVTLPASAIHTDERIYPNPDKFDGFRFAKLRESERDTVAGRHQTVSTSSEHLAFGIGRHICPGRFFAAIEVKAMFAYIVTTYDIEVEGGKGVPPDFSIAGLNFPRKVNVMFRARQK